MVPAAFHAGSLSPQVSELEGDFKVTGFSCSLSIADHSPCLSLHMPLGMRSSLMWQLPPVAALSPWWGRFDGWNGVPSKDPKLISC